jgi:hypothetical protein
MIILFGMLIALMGKTFSVIPWNFTRYLLSLLG